MPPLNWSKRVSRQQKRHGNSASADQPYIEKCAALAWKGPPECTRTEEHTSELQLLMRKPYAVFGLKKKTKKLTNKPAYSITSFTSTTTYTQPIYLIIIKY